MIKSYPTSIGNLECYTMCAISRIAVDVVTKEGAKELIQTANKHFRNKPFVLISDRKNSFNVDSSAYKFINPKKIVGIALVSLNEKVKNDAFEKQKLYDGAFGFFTNIEDAVDWAKTVVPEN